jgi:photosystem II stability/assembly factor-like uncharacterized protein
MKKHIPLHLLFIFAFILPGLAQWHWQYPIPQGNRLNDMVFLEGSEIGYAVGNGGAILKSTDQGVSWSLMDSATIVNLNGICFTGPNNGYIVGDNGVLLNTNASGQWVSMESGTHYHLNAIGAATAEKVYAAGYKGLILKKNGEAWEVMDSPTIFALYCIDFASATLGIAAGDSGTILRTADGGDSWSKVDVPYNTAFLDVYFPSENTGYLTGQQGLILKTSDGGVTWTDISYGQVESNLLSIHFYNDTSGYACGAKGVILSTVNGGANWTYVNQNTTLSFNEVFHLEPLIDTICDKVIFCGDNGVILRADSCIATLENITHGSAFTLSSIQFPELNKGYAVGGDPFNNKPFIVQTTDGENWTEIQFDTIKRYLTGIDFIDTSKAYISSMGGMVYRFMVNDALPIKTGFEDHLYAIRAFDSTTIYAAGLNGTLLKTISGDTTWTEIITNTQKHLYSLYFFNKNSGYAVGEGGIMLKISSGGDQVSKVTTGHNVPFYDVYFKDENIGFLVGYSGRILKVDRSSGVELITQVPSGVTTPLNEVYFANSSVGYIAGEGGVILKTTDGGDSWLPQRTGTQNGLRSLYFRNEAEGWVAGAGVSILKTENGGGAVISPGIWEHQREQYAISLYPNPASGQAWIEFELSERSRVVLSSWDLAGRQLDVIADEYRHGTVKYNYNTSGLPKGIYLLIIDIDGNRQAQKLVITK